MQELRARHHVPSMYVEQHASDIDGHTLRRAFFISPLMRPF